MAHADKDALEIIWNDYNAPTHPQRFLMLHGFTQHFFRLGRPLLQAVNYRLFRTQVFQVWKEIACA